VWEAIGDLPSVSSGGGVFKRQYGSHAETKYQQLARRGTRTLFNHICHRLTDGMLERIRRVPEGGNWRDIPFTLLPAGMKRARPTCHTKRYGRLGRDALASTILTKCDPHWGCYVHPTQDRTISVREAARLQGFPDKFVFAGEHISKQYEQVGNAVPVQLARVIGVAASEHLASLGIQSDSRLATRRAIAAKSSRRRR
jgi:DNA (cytosine-5)-methyltransferase 1